MTELEAVMLAMSREHLRTSGHPYWASYPIERMRELHDTCPKVREDAGAMARAVIAALDAYRSGLAASAKSELDRVIYGDA